jgi:phospholipid/cholesterol/gamma-HCH transport system ATP-binding protein
MSETLIKIENLHKSFGDQKVLQGVDLEINRGETIAIIGQSGCGKSVLLKHLIALLEPDEGQIIFDNDHIDQLSSSQIVKLRSRYGMLFQSAALFDSLTVAENVGLGLKESRQYSENEIDKIVEEKLSMVGLSDAALKEPAQLSGGMRKRVGLARAIAHSPEVLLYDEPTTGLDPITADMIDDLIVELDEKLNVTSIAVTHDLKSAFKIAQRVVMLYNGRVEFDGSPDEIKKTDNPVVKQFITGSSTGPIKM